MINRSRLACIVSLVLVALLTACSSPNPVLYTIAPTSGVTHTGAPKVIALRQIAVARYLERNQIVRSSENYKLEVMSNDWWGEPLGAMLARVLVDELGQRLPGSTVYAETGAVTVPADATVELNVDRMDLNPAGALIFQAQAAITLKGRAAPLTQSFRFDVPPPNDSIAGEVAAISTAVGQLADGIATMLATARAAR
jgi:uncharacterized lipoprotein YmbA